MNTTHQQIFFTPLTFQESLVKLQARVNAPSAASIFSKREIKFPEVQVKLAPEGRFSLRQRKSYFNPWAPTFEGTLLETDQQGTVVEGTLQTYPALRQWINLYHAALAGGTLAALMSLHSVYAYAMPKTWVFVDSFSIVWLVGLMTYLVISKTRCERRYKELAQGEDAFILSFLQNTLQARPAPAKEERGTPAEELLAA